MRTFATPEREVEAVALGVALAVDLGAEAVPRDEGDVGAGGAAGVDVDDGAVGAGVVVDAVLEHHDVARRDGHAARAEDCRCRTSPA